MEREQVCRELFHLADADRDGVIWRYGWPLVQFNYIMADADRDGVIWRYG
jgi:hypothetical protein